jgi:hypothetical protein
MIFKNIVKKKIYILIFVILVNHFIVKNTKTLILSLIKNIQKNTMIQKNLEKKFLKK